ncbi:MAG: single-stranded DNA-binding protein [Ornithinimicrobium sp.]
MNSITVTGNLGSDPELTYTPNGRAVLRATVFENRSRPAKDGEGWEELEPNRFRVQVWASLAENVAESCRQGDRITVDGTIITDRWADKETGEVRTAQTIRADEVSFSLKYHTVQATRSTKAGDQGEDENAAQQ